jgi:probable HAF family extracellular repeat protein
MSKLVVGAVLRAVLFVAAWLTCFPAHSAPSSRRFVVTVVQVTDLGTLGGAQSGALDINDGGQVVGWAATAQGVRHAFLNSNGTMTDVGSVLGNVDSEATGINSSGVIAGTMTDPSGPAGFVWNGGSVTQLVSSSAGHPSSAAAINDAGEVCGGAPPLAEVWSSTGTATELGVSALANDLNASGVVVGAMASRDNVWLNCATPPCTEEMPLPAPTSNYDPFYHVAYAINDHGDVVGNVAYTVGAPMFGFMHAVLWDGVSATSLDLGVLPNGHTSHAEDVNELRFIAGHGDEPVSQSPLFTSRRERAFLYHRDFGLFPLPALSATSRLGSCRAFALNEWKPSTSLIQLAGTCDVPGATHAVRWDVTVSSIPIFHPWP